ncbi:MAG TPA: VOC family protein [Pyrinomonadaceae bacterium]|nr:VOC family protein [Pyrinomonadaceae bacterium]
MSEQTATAPEQTPTHEPIPHGTICWNELASKDVEAAKTFYTELLGWKLMGSQAAGMNYTEIVVGDKHIGGMYQLTDECGGADATSHWMSYIAVDDVDTSARRAEELGGKVRVPPMDIPNVGRFCVINDPTGAAISLIKLGGA